MKQPTKIFFFPGGNAAVCDDKKQISELNHSWVLLFGEFLKKQGVKTLEGIELNLPGGIKAEFIDNGKNWRPKDGT